MNGSNVSFAVSQIEDCLELNFRYVDYQTLAHLSCSSCVYWISARATRVQRFLSVRESISASIYMQQLLGFPRVGKLICINMAAVVCTACTDHCMTSWILLYCTSILHPGTAAVRCQDLAWVSILLLNNVNCAIASSKMRHQSRKLCKSNHTSYVVGASSTMGDLLW